MDNVRSVERIIEPVPTLEGAGVRLKRVFGYNHVRMFDPFLLLDFFGSNDPDDYIAGFPWHPHRGIETVTYLIEGAVAHGDSIGNSGLISSGDIQWMTAGSGIIHQEMPQRYKGTMRGLQLWVNLPASLKMMEPRYRDIKSSLIPVVKSENGTEVGIIAGRYKDTGGAAQDLTGNPCYLDVTIPAGERFECDVPDDMNAFAFIIEGSGSFDSNEKGVVSQENCVLFGRGGGVCIRAMDAGLRFLLIYGRPLREPVAWRGPIVMNTEEELYTAFDEFNRGTFIKHKRNESKNNANSNEGKGYYWK